MKKPEQLQAINLEELREKCQEYLDFIDDDEEYNEDGDDDYENDILNAAMKAVFGKEVWKFINSRR